MENKIICPHCNQLECYVETENNIDSYLCLGCGYTTNSLYTDGSEELLKWEASTPLLIKKSKYIDPNTNLTWYPSVLNFPSRGMIFPDGDNEESWMWRMAPVISISEEEKSNYPIPGKPGEFYSTKIDMESSKFYEKHDFKTACEDLGILETK